MEFEYKNFKIDFDKAFIKSCLMISVSGAHAYGWATAESDIDVISVWMPDISQVLSIQFRGQNKEEKIEVDNKKTMDYKSYPLYNFMRLIIKGSGNAIENLFQDKLYSRDYLVKELQDIVMKNLHSKFLGHYDRYYEKTLKKDMLNYTRLEKYGIQKLILNSYRVLRTGIILAEKKTLIYNIIDQDKYFSNNLCLNILSDYVFDLTTNITILAKARKEINQLSLLLKEKIKECDWYKIFPSNILDSWLKKYYLGVLKEKYMDLGP